jgi:hypothetical protein
MRKAFAAILPVAALVVAGAAPAARATHRPVMWPFGRPTAVAEGESGRGDGPSTPTGIHLACRPGRRFALTQTIPNRSGIAVTLTGAVLDPPPVQVVRRIAVQFRLAPPPPKGDLVVIGLRRWNPSAARPVTIPPGRSAWVQSNFLMSGCDLLSPGRTLIANKAINVTYRANGRSGRERIAAAGTRILLTR